MATINLALNKTVMASNSVMPYTPSKAVNGSFSSTTPFSRWLCNIVPGWMSVDFGATYWINRWVVRHMPVAGWKSPEYNMSDFKLQGSNDNINWVDIDVLVGNILSTNDRMFTPVSFRYVRLYVTKGLNTNNKLASIMELEVYQAPSAYLAGLTISSGALSPIFAKTTLGYTAPNVEYSTSSVNVTPVAEDPQANIKVNGVVATSGNAVSVPLNVGSNAVAVVVTGAGGAPSYTYTINVTRCSPYLSGLSVSSGLLQETFSKNVYEYTENVASTVNSITVTPIAEDITATITVNTMTVISGNTSPMISLNEGSNIITVIVTSRVGTTQTYTITVMRASSACLSGIAVKSGMTNYNLTPNFVKTTYGYSTTINKNNASVNVTATVEQNNATLAINGSNAISGQALNILTAVGVTTVNIVVTAGIGSETKQYVVSITRPAT